MKREKRNQRERKRNQVKKEKYVREEKVYPFVSLDFVIYLVCCKTTLIDLTVNLSSTWLYNDSVRVQMKARIQNSDFQGRETFPLQKLGVTPSTLSFFISAIGGLVPYEIERRVAKDHGTVCTQTRIYKME